MRRPYSPVCSLRPRRPDRSAERGHATVVVATALLGVVVAVSGLVEVGGRLVDRASTEAVADVVALAGATEGREIAIDISTRNDATLIRFEQRGQLVQVEVERDGHRATSTAELLAVD